MAAFTLGTIRTSIDEWLENTAWGTSSQKDTIIVLAEEKINSIVSIAGYNTNVGVDDIVQDTNKIDTIVDSVTGPLSPLYLKIRLGADVVANPWSYLLLKDYSFLQEYAPTDNATGYPKYYSFYNDVNNANRSTVNFAPYANAAYDYEFAYFFEPASITAGAESGTTWLSTHAKNALLYGCITQAYIFMKGDQALMQVYQGKFMEALQALVASQGGSFRDTSFNNADNSPNMMAAQ